MMSTPISYVRRRRGEHAWLLELSSSQRSILATVGLSSFTVSSMIESISNAYPKLISLGSIGHFSLRNGR